MSLFQVCAGWLQHLFSSGCPVQLLACGTAHLRAEARGIVCVSFLGSGLMFLSAIRHHVTDQQALLDERCCQTPSPEARTTTGGKRRLDCRPVVLTLPETHQVFLFAGLSSLGFDFWSIFA